MGIISATMGVLFMNADRIITGITIRTIAAANHRKAEPKLYKRWNSAASSDLQNRAVESLMAHSVDLSTERGSPDVVAGVPSS